MAEAPPAEVSGRPPSGPAAKVYLRTKKLRDGTIAVYEEKRKLKPVTYTRILDVALIEKEIPRIRAEMAETVEAKKGEEERRPGTTTLRAEAAAIAVEAAALRLGYTGRALGAELLAVLLTL